jgi:hypothetical protein
MVLVFGREFALKDALVRTPVRLKLLHTCDQWHSSRVVASVTTVTIVTIIIYHHLSLSL